MITRRARTFFLLGFCVLAAGCQTASSGRSLLARKPSAEKQIASQETTRPSEVVLAPGMEIEWQANPKTAKPGQVHGGKTVVGPDGTVEVGPYGIVQVGGLSLNQASVAMEKHLAGYVKSTGVRLTASAPTTNTELAWRPARSTTGPELVLVSEAAPSVAQPVSANQTVTVIDEKTVQPEPGRRSYGAAVRAIDAAVAKAFAPLRRTSQR